MKKIISLLFLLTLILSIQAQAQTPSQLAQEISKTSDEEWEVLRLINIERVNNGQHILITTNLMQWMCGVRADELISTYSHDRPNGSSCFTIMDDCSFRYNACAENIAYGQRSAQAVVTAWMNSTGHRANILSGNGQRYMGVGLAENNGTKYWVQLFGLIQNSEAVATSLSDDGKFVILQLKDGTVGYVPNDPSIYITQNGQEVVNYPSSTSLNTGSTGSNAQNIVTTSQSNSTKKTTTSSSNSGVTVETSTTTNNTTQQTKRWVKNK